MYASFQKVNNLGADQTARMLWRVCPFVVRKPPVDRFGGGGGEYCWIWFYVYFPINANN